MHHCATVLVSMRLIGASRFAPLVLVVLVGKPSQRRFLTPLCCDWRRTTCAILFAQPGPMHRPSTDLPARLVSVSCSLRRFIPLSPGRARSSSACFPHPFLAVRA